MEEIRRKTPEDYQELRQVLYCNGLTMMYQQPCSNLYYIDHIVYSQILLLSLISLKKCLKSLHKRVYINTNTSSTFIPPGIVQSELYKIDTFPCHFMYYIATLNFMFDVSLIDIHIVI